MSIIYEGNTDLNEYEPIINKGRVAIYTRDDRIYNQYPIGASLTAVPVLIPTLFILNQTGTSLTWHTRIPEEVEKQIPYGLEVLVASILVALTAIFIYLIARQYLDELRSLLLTFIFAFCTSAWSTASRALWQHAPSMLMLSIALYLILRAREKPRLIQFASLPLAFSYVVRPTNLISVLVLSLYVLIQFRGFFVKYVLWALPVAIPFLIFNLSIYGTALSPYYTDSQQGPGISAIAEALAGNLFSPGRGLFVFTPVLLLAVLGFIWKARIGKIERMDYFIAVIILLHWISMSTTNIWWGGWSFGPRYFTDMLPYLIYFLIPVLVFLPTLESRKKRILSGILAVSVAISFFINFSGVWFIQPWQWNSIPNNIDQHHERVWDWRDPQFLRWITK